MRTAMMMTVAVGTVVLSVAPAWAGGGGGGHDCAFESDGGSIAMFDDCFAGRVHRVRAGARLEVRNEGSYDHTLTAGDGSFDTGTVAAGESETITVDTPGAYPILCTIHGWYMGGTLIVEDASSVAAATGVDDAPPWMEPEAGFATAGLLVGAVGHRWWSRRGRARAG